MAKLNPENRRHIVDDALIQMYGTKQKSESDLLYEKAKRSTEYIRNCIKPILQSGGWKDRQSLRVIITKLYLEEFSKYSHEELENLISMLHVEIMMETIEAAPWGNDKPDLLGGI